MRNYLAIAELNYTTTQANVDKGLKMTYERTAPVCRSTGKQQSTSRELNIMAHASL